MVFGILCALIAAIAPYYHSLAFETCTFLRDVSCVLQKDKFCSTAADIQQNPGGIRIKISKPNKSQTKAQKIKSRIAVNLSLIVG